MTAYTTALPSSGMVAVYGPWYYAADQGPPQVLCGSPLPVGRGGSDPAARPHPIGVHKAPAGVATVLSGASAPYLQYTNGEQDSIAQAVVNLIKPVPGSES